MQGFTLLEVLVAFTLLALVMATLMQVFTRGVTNADIADRYAKAAMLAESKLATVGVEEALVEGDTNGQFNDDYAWRLSVRPYVTTLEPKTLSSLETTALANNQLLSPGTAQGNSAAQTQLGNVDIEALLPVRLYEIELSVVFKSDDNRERVITVNTMRMGQRV
jgi:type II secretory pathway pseudopilin PulG